MTKSFAQIIAQKINGLAKSTKNRQNKGQDIISLTFEHANNCGDYSALTKFVNVLGSHEKRHVIGYIVAHSMNLKYDTKKQQFKKTTKKSTVAFDCEAIAKVTWHEYAKIADKSIPVNADKMYTFGPQKSQDKKVAEAVAFTGNTFEMELRRAMHVKCEAMTLEEKLAFAGIENAKTDLKIAA